MVPQRDLEDINSHSHTLLHSQAADPANLFSVSVDLCLLDILDKQDYRTCHLFDWLLSFTVMFLRFTHVTACIVLRFFLLLNRSQS